MSDQLPKIELPPRRPIAILAIAVTGVVASTAVSTFAYAVNAWICPFYFYIMFPGHEPDDIFRASVERGYFCGLFGGICLSFMYVMAVMAITGLRCFYSFAARNLLSIVIGTVLCWVAGGLVAMMIAYIYPVLLHNSIPAPPMNGMDVRMQVQLPFSFVWTSGSIWGLYIGGLVSTAVGLFVFQANWFRAFLKSELH